MCVGDVPPTSHAATRGSHLRRRLPYQQQQQGFVAGPKCTQQHALRRSLIDINRYLGCALTWFMAMSPWILFVSRFAVPRALSIALRHFFAHISFCLPQKLVLRLQSMTM
eukprot:scaffold235748_cov17-Tisochrysis_lutea.AAC.2